MSSAETFVINSTSFANTLAIATTLGRKLKGGELVELIGDLGAGKTAFVRGLAAGVQSPALVQSPTFTISRIYQGKSVTIHHFDFHRLDNPGIMAEQLHESLTQHNVTTVIEWSQIIQKVLPAERLQVQFKITGDESRQLRFAATDAKHQQLIEGLKK